MLAATALANCADAIPGEFGLPQGNFAHARCFGNQVDYTNHPDGLTDGSFGAGDLGLVYPYADPTADPNNSPGPSCSATVMNNMMTNVSAYMDTAIAMHAMTSCAARIEEKALPTAENPVDLSSTLQTLDDDLSALTITRAEVSYETNGTEDVFVTTLEGTLADVPRSLDGEFLLVVRHVPLDEQNATYKGVIQFLIKDLQEGTSPDDHLALSLTYSYQENDLQYRYRQVFSATEPQLTGKNKFLSKR